MRTLLSIALGLACSVGAFAADNGNGGAAGGSSVGASTQQKPINSVDPVTGKAVDASLPPVLVPNPMAMNANGSTGNASGGAASGSNPGMGAGAQQGQQMLAIGISDRSSAEIIRANPQLYLPAARANKRFDQVGGQSSGSQPGAWQHGTDTSGTSSTGLDNAAGSGQNQGNTRSDSSVNQGSGYPATGGSSPGMGGDQQSGDASSGAAGSSFGSGPLDDGSSSNGSSSGGSFGGSSNGSSGSNGLGSPDAGAQGDVKAGTSPGVDPIPQNSGAGADVQSGVQGQGGGK